MQRFSFKAYSSDGNSVSGDIEASDDANALDIIARRGLIPVTLTTGRTAGPWWSREINFSGSAPELNARELQLVFSTLSSLLSASLPLSRALSFCESQVRTHRTKSLLAHIQNSIANGETLSNAFASSDLKFPDRFLAMIELGETSNTLADVMENLVKLIAAETRTRQQLRSALIYPGILMVMSGFVLTLVIFYLVPTLLPVFASARTDAPPVLKFFGNFRETVLSFWPLMMLGIAILATAIISLTRLFRAQFDAFKIRLPLVGPYIRQRETLQLCRMLGILLVSGSTLSAALATVRSATSHDFYEQLLKAAGERIESGGTLSETLSASPLIDPMAKALIEAGEESDRLSQMLGSVATNLEGQAATTLERAISIVTPLLTLLIGIGIGAVILSIISAILDLNDIAF